MGPLVAMAGRPTPRRIIEETARFHRRFFSDYSGKTVLVGMDEARAVSARDGKHCIGTTSLLCCAGIALYDPGNGVAAASHMFVPSRYEKGAVSILAKMLTEALLDADSLGGSSYVLTAFNFRHGCRDALLSGELCRKLQGIAMLLGKTGKIARVDHRDERQFVLDSISREIFTGQ